MDKSSIKKYEFKFSKEEIEKLNQKLNLTVYPDETTDSDNFFKIDDLKILINQWKNLNYDRVEKIFNKFNHFHIHPVDDTEFKLHYIFLPNHTPGSKALMLVHGWPGTFFEFYKVIEPLHKLGYSVVVPSLPGFGFSSIPKKSGYGVKRIAELFHELMITLGFNEYFVQGGDWGSFVTRWMGALQPKHCKAIHINMCMVPPPLTSPIELVKLLGYFASDYTRYFPLPKTLFYSKDEIHHFEKMLDFQRKRMAYFQIQSTEPDRLGVGLNDSPVGLLAWIGVIVSAASSNRITNEEVLINCSIFWFTKTISSSMRLYKEEKDLSKRVDYVSVPTGVAIFPEELGCSPKSWAKVHMNIKSWNYLNKGGHFAAFGVPEIFVEEIHQFFKNV